MIISRNMDKELFYTVCSKIINSEHKYNGIGTYGEKTIHAVLKSYFEPYYDNHEQRTGKFVADIVGENGIIEIQTGGFDKLRNKLKEFLTVAKVTVVYPIPHNKWLISLNSETGEAGRRRKSPHTGTIYDVFPELYKIKSFLNDDNFNLCLILIDMDEYRCSPETTGLKRGRRKGYTRYDRIPLELVDEIHLCDKSDWLIFIPNGLSEEFTAKDFSAQAKIHISDAQLALNILSHMGIVIRIGKKGNSYIYIVNSDSCPQ